MSTLRTLRRRIRSVENTRQITKAMEMVAAAKLRRAQARAQAARPYAVKISEMLAKLAGAYNSNLIRAAEQRLRKAPAGSLQLILAGRKGRDYFKRRSWPTLAVHTPLPPEASLEFARELTEDLIRRFLAGEVDRVEVMHTEFITAMTRKIVTETFLPVGADAESRDSSGDTIFEPDAASIFAELLPRYATAKLFAALADALASEHAARMIAMGAARKNAGELIDALVLQRNRVRQAVITKELLDIVGGAEALK